MKQKSVKPPPCGGDLTLFIKSSAANGK